MIVDLAVAGLFLIEFIPDITDDLFQGKQLSANSENQLSVVTCMG